MTSCNYIFPNRSGTIIVQDHNVIVLPHVFINSFEALVAHLVSKKVIVTMQSNGGS